MQWRMRALIAVLAVGAIGTAVTLALRSHHPPIPAPSLPAVAAAPPEPVAEHVPIERGDTLDALLSRASIETPERVAMISAVQGVFDVRKLRVGTQLTLTRRAGAFEGLNYVIDPDHELRLTRSPDGQFGAEVVDIPGRITVTPVCGTMQGSLFETIDGMGERPELALQVADIFAWDLDFYTDPQNGDDFCVVLEKKEYDNGQPSAYRRILAASYNNAGTLYEGFLFSVAEGRPAYYSRDGRSLQAAFLHSPLKFEARVSSHFSRSRLHPVLGVRRAHLGTDYAVPTGASVQAIASGRVTFAGRSGQSGNMVTLRHSNGYESLYLHLSRIYVRPGQTVAQGQRIALSGATGLVTGPHLDFRLRRNGTAVNFERFRPPRATQLEGPQMAAFTAERDQYAAILASGSTPQAAQAN